MVVRINNNIQTSNKPEFSLALRCAHRMSMQVCTALVWHSVMFDNEYVYLKYILTGVYDNTYIMWFMCLRTISEIRNDEFRWSPSAFHFVQQPLYSAGMAMSTPAQLFYVRCHSECDQQLSMLKAFGMEWHDHLFRYTHTYTPTHTLRINDHIPIRCYTTARNQTHVRSI